MQFPFLLQLLLIFSVSVYSKTIEVKCPDHCKCDTYEKLRRAKCTNQKLVVIESFLRKETQLLDVSYNQISSLEDHTFFEQELLSLKLLNMSHNKIGQIHMSAFEGLSELRTLDLSYNAMRYLLVNWFWSLNALEEVYLRGNSFGRLNDEPVFESKSLKTIDLAECDISYVGLDTFAKVTNLQHLDLSHNDLIQIELAVIKPLRNLQVLRANNNSLNCNETSLTNFCKDKGIRFITGCDNMVTTRIEKSQKIVLADDEQSEEKNSWIFEDEIVNIACNQTVVNNTHPHIDKSASHLVLDIIELSPILTVSAIFIYGLLVGILIGCCFQMCRNAKVKGRNETQLETDTYVGYDEGGHLRRQRSNSFYSKNKPRPETESLVMSEWTQFESTPMPTRKSAV